jgi:hypothetical protein
MLACFGQKLFISQVLRSFRLLDQTQNHQSDILIEDSIQSIIQNEIQSLHNSSKRKLKSNISGNKNIEIFDDKQKHNKYKRSEIANIFQIQKENNHYCYNINRSNSNRYKRK